MALTDKLKAIGDAVRAKNGSTDKYSLDGLVTAIETLPTGGDKWVRPAGWPNLDALDLSAYDDCYVYTLDNTNKCDYNWFSHRVGVSPVNNGVCINIKQGTIDVSGNFILEKEYNNVRTDKFFYTSIYDYPVFILTAPGLSITQALVNDSPNYPGGGSLAVQYIKTLEIRVKVTNNTSNLGNSTSRLCGNSVKRIKVENATKLTALTSTFESNYLLEELVFENCDFSKVTNWNNAFRNLTSIKDWSFIGDIDFSAGTTFTSCFSGSNYDGSGAENIKLNNAINLTSMFQNCVALKKLDLSQCEGSNKLTSVTAIFQNNYNLEFLDCSGLDFTNVTNTSSAFTTLPLLHRFKIPKNLTASFSFGNLIDYNDTIQMIDDLETTTSGTWSLGNLKYYLTQSDKDKITTKGWTIA